MSDATIPEIIATLIECRELLSDASGSALLSGEPAPEKDKASIRSNVITVNNYLMWAEDEIAKLRPVDKKSRGGMRMIDGHPNGDPMNDPPSLR